MKDIDIISIFSNLLNNAIEGSETSEKKLIYVNIYKTIIILSDICIVQSKKHNVKYVL